MSIPPGDGLIAVYSQMPPGGGAYIQYNAFTVPTVDVEIYCGTLPGAVTNDASRYVLGEWSGWVVPDFSETYTFTANPGVFSSYCYQNSDLGNCFLKLNTIAIIPGGIPFNVTGGVTATAPMVAGVAYPVDIARSNIKDDYWLQMQWQSASQSKTVVLQRNLYTNITPQIISFTATWGITCASRNTITLTWSTVLGNVTFDHGIGAVANSGTIQVQYDGNPTYTLTLTGIPYVAGGSGTIHTQTLTQPVTATPGALPNNMILLPAANATAVYFASGANYAAGLYLITCCGGAFSWDGAKLGINANDRHIPSSQAFKVFGSQGNQIDAPGNYPGYGSVAASDAANQGLTQFFSHAGGPVGVFLNLDDYSRAVVSSEPPGFSISGPAPSVSLTANATPVLAGTSVTLTWAVTGSVDTVTIDQGIGSVSASGSQAVSVTTTTRYTLTAVYQGITVTTYADVLVGVPTVPVVVLTSNCGGTINIAWALPSYTANTLIERSAIGGGVGFSQIASVAYPVHVSIETPPVAGTTYFYRLRTTDGTNFSAYSQEQAAASLVVPPAVTLASYLDGRGVPVLTWTANTTATSYLLKRGTISGQETTLYTLAVTTPGQGFIIKDPSASVGVLTYYVVAGVNSCGTGAVSNEVSVNPGTANPYQTATSWTT